MYNLNTMENEAIFESADMAQSVSTITFKNDKVILIPTYLGKTTAKMKIENIPPIFNLEWEKRR